MKNVYIFLIVYSLIIFVKNISGDETKQVKKFVMGYGYPFEVHSVTTKDGYILQLHRIPRGLSTNGTQIKSVGIKPVVLINHGLADSSAAFLFGRRNESLAYILADNGYDVWLGNHRGNKFSRKHKKLLTFGLKYWNFSFHESGLYDYPAEIDFILKKTNQKRLFHVCHSGGCTELFVLTSMKPEYNRKISISVNLSPSILFGHSSWLLRGIFMLSYILQEFLGRIGYIKVLDRTIISTYVTRFLCSKGSSTRYLCFLVMYIIHGFDWFSTDSGLLSKYVEVYPVGTSMKEVIHYGSMYFYPGTFRQFDHGSCKNKEIYNSTRPPKYPLEKSTLPVVIFYGEDDNMGNVKDMKLFAKMIPNVMEGKALANFNNLGYFLNPKAPNLVYKRILQLFAEY